LSAANLSILPFYLAFYFLLVVTKGEEASNCAEIEGKIRRQALTFSTFVVF
jgi:hypothetical protein